MTQTENYQKWYENGNFLIFKKNIKIVSKTQILGAHEAITIVPEYGHMNWKKREKKEKYG